MKEQKVVITDSSYDINKDLQNGWKIVFQPTAQHVATANSYSTLSGKFCFVLERDKQ